MRAAFVLKDRSDPELLAGVKDAVAREFEDVAVVVAHLAEMDKRELFKAEGYSSLFKYCVEVLHLSESQTYLRIDVARVAQKYPVVLEMLADGQVQLSAVHRLGPSLTEENHRELLQEAVHKNKEAIEEIVARLRPKPPVPSLMRKLPSVNSSPVADSEPGLRELFESRTASGGSADSLQREPVVAVETKPVRPHSTQESAVSPLAPEIYKIQSTVNAKTRRKIKQLQEMMGHRIPNGDVGKIIELAIDLLFDEVSREKFAIVKHPRKKSQVEAQAARSNDGSSGHDQSRHIPAEVKRAVWQRDQGRCAFVSKSGKRCSERGRIEYHHVVPFAWGGESTVQNIQLRCRTHNAY